MNKLKFHPDSFYREPRIKPFIWNKNESKMYRLTVDYVEYIYNIMVVIEDLQKFPYPVIICASGNVFNIEICAN